MTGVLDASALLALLYREEGHEYVAERLEAAAVCAVNWSETRQKLVHRGSDADRIDSLRNLGMRVEPFTDADARATAELWVNTKRHGLSLADRACLALAQRLDLPALTADKAWIDIELPVTVQLIR